MTYLTDHWAFDPFLIVVAILVVWHEVGLARLARRSRPERSRQRRLRSVWFYCGLAVLLISVESPIDYLADRYFFMHMIQHLLLMFAAPTLVVAGAPWQPLLDGLPGRWGKSATGEVMRARWSAPLRAVGGLALRPRVAIVAFCVVMVFWHLPGPFDLAYDNQAVHIWLMHGTFFLAGVLFWLQYIPSPPLRIRMTPVAQAGGLFVTNVVMWILAMAMGILSQASWYSVYAHVPGVTLPPFPDQQIGAGILWVCGDFWAVPMMVIVMRRLIAADGSVGAAIDRMLGRGSGGGPQSGYHWAGRP